MKFSDMILQTATQIVVFIILTFSVYLFFAGHHHPGGGFIGGLVSASALVLLFMAYDVKTVQELIPVDFKRVAALGAFIAVFAGLGALVFDAPFLSQTLVYVQLPILGETELATATLFDVGVFLVVIGVAITIILSIGEDV